MKDRVLKMQSLEISKQESGEVLFSIETIQTVFPCAV